jgi:short-subunit dehydrogenase
MARSLNQQVVVISGAGSGFGLAAARLFASSGAKVVVGGRNENALRAIEQEVQSGGGEIASAVTDVAERDQVERLASLAIEKFGRIDTWVNNAGVSLYSTFEKVTEDEIHRIFQVNFMGQVHGMWAAVPRMRQNGGGVIINVASVVGKRAMPLQNFYSASKFAVVGLSEALRTELAIQKANIKICVVCPPSVNTPFYDNAGTKEGYCPRPLPFVAEPEVLARAIVSCARRPRREMWVTLTAKAFVSLSILFPWFMDLFIRTIGFRAELTQEPKPADAPSNLFAPTPDVREKADWTAWANREDTT